MESGWSNGHCFLLTAICRKIDGWVKELEKLSKIATTQPHAAYAAFTHCLSSKWNHLIRVSNWEALLSSDLLQPLETTIQIHFIPALIGHPPRQASSRNAGTPCKTRGFRLDVSCCHCERTTQHFTTHLCFSY